MMEEEKKTASDAQLDTDKDGSAQRETTDIAKSKNEGKEENQNTDIAIEEVISVPLDELLYEGDEFFESHETPEETVQYEEFLADYKATIAETLAAAKKLHEGERTEDTASEEVVENKGEPDAESVYEAEEKQDNGMANGEWHSDITLTPEKYEDTPSDESSIFKEASDDTAIAYSYADDESENAVQLEMNFCEEETAPEQDDEYEYDPEKPRRIDSIFDFVELFVFTLVAVMIITTFFFRHSVVQGDSMLKTLEDGDHLIISDLLYTPERYDIVVFEDYSTSLKKAVVKRVIGLPGETVKVELAGDGEYLVYVDGELLTEEYAYTNIRYSSPNVGEWTVGEDEIFVMGDNRYNSTDSRDESVGPVKIDSVLGKVLLRFYPFDKFGTVE